jgi:hypothetical protein
LRRYKGAIKQEYPGHKAVLLFLSPDGEQPTDPDWIALSYDEVLVTTEAARKSWESTLGRDVVTALRHYATMLRRHIVSDSDVAELCRKLYRAHQKAFDLVFEHRPDLQSGIREGLEQLLQTEPKLGMDHCTKAYVRFYVKWWDEDERLKTGTWTVTGRVLLFEIQNFDDSVRLKLIIGPGEAAVREQLFEFAKAHKDLYRGIRPKLSAKFTQVYAHSLLEKGDFDAPPEEVIQKARTALSTLLAGDITQITIGLREILRLKA